MKILYGLKPTPLRKVLRTESRADFARKMGVSQAAMSLWLHGERGLRPKHRERLFKLLVKRGIIERWEQLFRSLGRGWKRK